MIDEPQIERLLRARPAGDPPYVPGLAGHLATPGREHPHATVTWRSGRASPMGGLLLVLLLIGVLLATAVMLVGSPRTKDLDALPTPVTAVAAPDPIPLYPGPGVRAILQGYVASRWGDDPNVGIDSSVVKDGRIWNESTDGLYPGGTIVRLGSVSRLFLAPIALQLSDANRLNLPSPVIRYVPSWPGGDAIRVRQLLDGSSGVASFGEPVEDLAKIVEADPKRIWTAADALRLAQAKSPRFQPGARHEPVDTEDALLVAVIEAVTGEPVMDAIDAGLRPSLIPRTPWLVNVQRPGELQFPPQSPDSVLVAGLWDQDGTGTPTPVADLPANTLAVLGPARGMLDSVNDLVLDMEAFQTSDLLSVAARAAFARPVQDGGYGGLATCPCVGGTHLGVGLVGHTGPYTALVVHIPSESWSVALVANVAISDADLADLLDQIHDVVWPAIR